MKVLTDYLAIHVAGFLPVLYDEGLTRNQLSSVIGHECAHIKRQDVSTLTVAAVLRGLMWIHPLIWLVIRRIVILAEQSADALVLDAGVNPDNHATTLTNIVRKHVFQRQEIFSSVGFIDYKHTFFISYSSNPQTFNIYLHVEKRIYYSYRDSINNCMCSDNSAVNGTIRRGGGNIRGNDDITPCRERHSDKKTYKRA